MSGGVRVADTSCHAANWSPLAVPHSAAKGAAEDTSSGRRQTSSPAAVTATPDLAPWTAATLRGRSMGPGFERISFVHFSGYATRLAAYATVIDGEDRLLLTWWNGEGRGVPGFTMPGGGVEYDESLLSKR